MKKQAAMIAICAALLICVAAAGCTGSSSSPSASATAHSSSKAATASTTVKPTPTVTVTPTVKPTPTVIVTPTVTPTASTISTPSNVPATGVPVLYFYYRPDCPYCQALEPQITALQTQYGGKVSVQWIVSQGEVPTLVLFNKSGVQVGSWVNPGTTAPITAKIDSLLAAG
jgi:thiol-disulfide isomerase/thioredoxin